MAVCWNRLDWPDLGLFNSWSETFNRLEWQEPGTFPDLHSARHLMAFSDSSGEHAGSSREAWSLLLIDSRAFTHWEARRRRIRALMPDQRRIAFKNLNDRYRRKVLASFLEAADQLDGLLFTAVFDKAIRRTMMGDLTGRMDELSADERSLLTALNKRARDRVLFSMVLLGFLLGGLTSPGQDVVWFVDIDDSVATRERVIGATSLFGRIVGHFLPHDLGHMRFGTTACDCQRQIEDLCAVADLSAGAFLEGVSRQLCHTGIPAFPRVAMPFPQDLALKSWYINGWLAKPSPSLRKVNALIAQGDRPGAVKLQVNLLKIEPGKMPRVVNPAAMYPASIFS